MRRGWLLPSLLGALGVLVSAPALLSALPAQANTQASVTASSTTNLVANDSPTSNATSQADTQLEEIRVTPDGFLLRISGDRPDVDQDYDENDRELRLELQDSAISRRLTTREVQVDRYGVDRIRIRQDGDEVDVIFYLTETSPQWRFSVGPQGVALVPSSGTTAGLPGRTNQSLTGSAPATNQPSPPATGQNNGQSNNGQSNNGQSNNGQSNNGQSNPVATPPQATPRPDARARLEELLRRRNQIRQQRETQTTSGDLPNVADRNLSIVIDPGHGGPDPGAVGIGGIRETDIVLDISLQLAALLERQGMEVILTRREERDVDLQPRVDLANRSRSDLFVSVHANAISMSRPDVNGVETYYYSEDGKEFAEYVQNAMLEASGMRNRGVKFARFFVIRRTAMPAILVEVGFVTGEQDAPRLADPQFRTLMAEAIARGILQYVQQN